MSYIHWAQGVTYFTHSLSNATGDLSQLAAVREGQICQEWTLAKKNGPGKFSSNMLKHERECGSVWHSGCKHSWEWKANSQLGSLTSVRGLPPNWCFRFDVQYVGGLFSLGRAYKFQIFYQLIVKLLFLNYFPRNFTYKRYFVNASTIIAA